MAVAANLAPAVKEASRNRSTRRPLVASSPSTSAGTQVRSGPATQRPEGRALGQAGHGVEFGQRGGNDR